MSVENLSNAPKFPVLVITESRGIHARASMDELTPKSLAAATQGFFSNCVILDSDYNKWTIKVWRREKKEEPSSKPIPKLFGLHEWEFLITYKIQGKFDLDEMKDLISNKFDPKNDFYSEFGITSEQILSFSSIFDAIRTFSFR